MAVSPPRPKDLPLTALRAFEAAARLGGFTPRGPVFSLYALAVEEAAGGAGVLIGHGALVAGHLARGSLVAPFGLRAPLPRALRLWSARALTPGSAAHRVAKFLADMA